MASLAAPRALPRGGQTSELEDRLAFQIRAYRLPAPERDTRWHPTRRWRADFLWRDRMLMVEVEGGAWVGGRHVSGAGFEADIDKYNAAVLMGFRVVRVSGRMVKDGRAIRVVWDALGGLR